MVNRKEVRVLHITTHLGGGLGTAISSYIANSNLSHTVLELEKTINPCLLYRDFDIITMSRREDLTLLARNSNIVLLHYYCHPLAAWTLFELNTLLGVKIVTWCHNNGVDFLRPLPDALSDMSDVVILSGCQDDRFSGCDIIRPIPQVEVLEKIAAKLQEKKDNKLLFRYIGSLSYDKIHEDAENWFVYLSENWNLQIATLDIEHNFFKFDLLSGITERSLLYDCFFCAIYPLKSTHYGCGELGLQELLMLGYPVILRRNKIEIEIVNNLEGVYFADSFTEFCSVCSEVSVNWDKILFEWKNRSEKNIQIIRSRYPYNRLDKLIYNAYRKDTKRECICRFNIRDLIKFSYNQKSEEGLRKIFCLWKKNKQWNVSRKGSPAQFEKYFPEIKDCYKSVITQLQKTHPILCQP